MVISLNYLTLYRFDKSLDFPISIPSSNSPGRDIRFDFEFDQDGSFSVLAPAYALNITKKLSLGVTFNIWNASVTGASQYEKKQISSGFLPSGDSSIQFRIEDTDQFEITRGYSLVIGGIYRFNENWKVGVVAKTEF